MELKICAPETQKWKTVWVRKPETVPNGNGVETDPSDASFSASFE